MGVLERLSSVAGDRCEASNKAVAREALEQPDMLDEVAIGLEWDDPLRALEMWEGKHAKLVLEAMDKLVEVEPGLKVYMQTAARGCLDHRRANVRRMAQKIVRSRTLAIEKGDEK
ncbi:MAG: hypothetical protein SWK90_19860 [Chloroflexota bacterium]|nr:hypothetical protein [Chloroflexota bacterium]